MTRVHILLATHNGTAFLQEQLQSYLDQSHPDWALWVSDDASTDATRNILHAFQQAHPRREIRIMPGPNRGLFANFMHLIRHPDLPSGFVALSDQDDVWLPHRLTRALDALAPCYGDAFYCSTRILTDVRLRPLSPKPPAPLPPASFQNALVQNVAAGNTIMLNPKAMQRLRNDPQPPCSLPYHDWWIYLRLMAADAALVCDAMPGLLYRQHDHNFLGHRKTQRWARLRALLDGTYGAWVTRNAHALLCLRPDSLSPAHRQAAEILLSHPSRLQALRQSKARRSDRIGQLMLPLLAVLNRL